MDIIRPCSGVFRSDFAFFIDSHNNWFKTGKINIIDYLNNKNNLKSMVESKKIYPCCPLKHILCVVKGIKNKITF